MKAICFGVPAVIVVFSGLWQANSAENKHAGSDKEKLIGAWHLARIETAGVAGEPIAQPKGMLIYTGDGHMSVQLMYPKSANAQSNEYVQDGYEASFGSYDVDEVSHTLTHHVQGSNTRGLLVGKDLPRIYQLSQDGHLIVKPVGPNEHWSVTWEHY